MQKKPTKVATIVLWLVLCTLLGLSALINLLSSFNYSRMAPLIVFICAILLLLFITVRKYRFYKKNHQYFSEIIFLILFSLVFFTTKAPNKKLSGIAEQAGLEIPPETKLLSFNEIIGFVGSEENYNITLSFPKKYVLQFTKPLWPEEGHLCKVVPDNEREGLPILVFRDEYSEKIKLLESWVDNPDVDPNLIIKTRDEVLGKGGQLPCDFKALNHGNKKHWAASSGNVNLFLDLENPDTAIAYMFITIY